MKSRTIYCVVPTVLLAGWAGWFFASHTFDADQCSRPLVKGSMQWYVGRDGNADAKSDIRGRRLKLYGGGCGDVIGGLELGAYRRILLESYSVALTPLFDGDSAPDKYVVPYMNAYNAVITDYLKAIHGADVMARISSESKKMAELERDSTKEPTAPAPTATSVTPAADAPVAPAAAAAQL